MLSIRMKRVRSLLVIVAVLVLLAAMINVGLGAGSTRLYVDPPVVTGYLGGTFTVDIMVEDVEDLFTWQVMMLWTGSALKCNSITYGDFMQQARDGSGISSDAAAGQKEVYVSSITYFDAGMSVRIYDDSNSEENVIASILGYKLTMASDLAHTYTVGAHGQIDTYPGTTPSSRIESTWLMAGEMTSVTSAGAYGSGWLATIEFEVLSETATDLDIFSNYPDYTYLLDRTGWDIPDVTVEDGEYITPPPEDLNCDGWIDIFDLCQVALHYGETGTPGWIPEDFTGPTPYEPDGIVDLRELTAICLKYGTAV